MKFGIVIERTDCHAGSQQHQLAEEHVVETAFGRMSNDIESIRACHVQNTLSQQLLGAEHVKAHANNRAEYYSVCIHSCGRVVNIWMFSI